MCAYRTQPRRSGLQPLPLLAFAGFTLIELLVVIAIMAIAVASVGFLVRDGTADRIEREAVRLAALLESARARSQLSGVAARWQPSAQGFHWEGLPPAERADQELPRHWLHPDTAARIAAPTSALNNAITSPSTAPHTPLPAVILGPEPILPPQRITLYSRSEPAVQIDVDSDGLRPFDVR
ncbi:GspH/FimT family pseudopilin [Candidatus Symbiobacter mobilis]|nr:GspH/FimT family pseudopilin [Candidatus Symbiobacter mobilis]